MVVGMGLLSARVLLFQTKTEEGKLYLFVAIDRTSKYAYTELHERSTKMIAADFLRSLLKAIPYRIHTVLTNGIQFTNRACDQYALYIFLIASALSMASNTDSQNQNIPGRTDRSSA